MKSLLSEHANRYLFNEEFIKGFYQTAFGGKSKGTYLFWYLAFKY